MCRSSYYLKALCFPFALLVSFSAQAQFNFSFWQEPKFSCTSTSGNIIPLMTSNTAPSGVASASGIYSATFDAYRAFDQTSHPLGWYERSGFTTGWLQYQFSGGQIIIKYALMPAWGYANAAPKNWTILGSNDGVSWTTLDTRIGEVFATDSTVKKYSFSNSTSYTYYRINVTLNGGNASYLGVGFLALCNL